MFTMHTSFFCEMKEIVTRPSIYKSWKKIEKFTVPNFKYGYTVNDPIAREFNKMYGVKYKVIRNLPVLKPLTIPSKKEKYILYQGAVNEGRSFETLIPAMKYINSILLICGDGNFMEEAKELVKQNQLEKKVIFKGKILPEALQQYTQNAWIGVTLFEKNGLSNYYSLANRFFDYIHAGLPQICVNYPVYSELNNQYNIGIMIDDLNERNIAAHINQLLEDEALYFDLQKNCLKTREILNWQQEEKNLIAYYKEILNSIG